MVYFKASQDCISLRNFLALGFSLLFRNILKTLLGQYHIFVRKTRRYCRTIPLSPLISVVQTIYIMFQFFPNLTHLCTQLSWNSPSGTARMLFKEIIITSAMKTVPFLLKSPPLKKLFRLHLPFLPNLILVLV